VPPLAPIITEHLLDIVKFFLTSYTDVYSTSEKNDLLEYSHSEYRYLEELKSLSGVLLFRLISVLDPTVVAAQLKSENPDRKDQEILKFAIENIEKIFEATYTIFKRDFKVEFEGCSTTTDEILEATKMGQDENPEDLKLIAYDRIQVCVEPSGPQEERLREILGTFQVLKKYVDCDDDLSIPFLQYCKLETLTTGTLNTDTGVLMVGNIWIQAKFNPTFE
jgi:hypothetical protein